MQRLIRNRWPLLAATAVFIGTIAIVLPAALRQTGGHLVYALDDAYIHMAMATNLARHGVYGVTEYEFSSSSSSPLWTLLLALAALPSGGVLEFLPLLLNLVLGLAMLAVLDRVLGRSAAGPATKAVALIAVIFATPMPAMVFSGMEHLFHSLLTLLFLWLFARIITAGRRTLLRRDRMLFFLLAAALVLVRYESYALLAIAVLLFLLRRRPAMAGGLCAAGMLPLVSYQAVSVASGWSWLPNSILIRTGVPNTGGGMGPASPGGPWAGIPGVLGVVSNFLGNLETGLPLASLVAAALVLLAISSVRTPSFWTPPKVMASMFILGALAHAMFGHIGHFFRYEAYLIAIGLFTSACILPEVVDGPAQERTGRRRRPLLMLALGTACVPALILLTLRSKDSLGLIPAASRNIFEQQYQMGTFLQRFYPGAGVAVNDIGAVSFLARVHLVDLVGLASADVLRLKRSGEYDAGNIRTLCQKRGVRVAIVYDSWLRRIGDRGGPLPWTKVGEWRISDNVVCSDDVVSIYAAQASERDGLVMNLRQFSHSLPANVEQSGPYTEPPLPPR